MTLRIPVITLLCFGVLRSEILYPHPQKLPIQWSNEGAWHSCSNNSVIRSQNCNPDNEKFVECYKIPEEGLCSDLISSSVDMLYAFTSFMFKNQSSFSLRVNGQKQNETQILKVANSIVLLNFKNPGVPFRIGYFRESGDDLYLTQSNIQSTQMIENCLRQDENLQCLECAQYYDLYEWQCVPLDCIYQIQNLITNGMSQQLNYSGGNVTLEFIINNLQSIGDCFVPMVYLIQNFDNSSTTYMFPKDHLYRPDERQVALTIPLQELAYLPCNQFETSSGKVFQLYVSLSITVKGKIQFQYIAIIRIMVENTASTQVSLSEQGFSLPDQCCESLSVNLLSEAKITNVVSQNTKTYIQAQQILIDPTYKYQSIQFQSASLISNQSHDLQHENSTLDNLTINYYLSIDTSSYQAIKNSSLQLTSTLVNNRRILVNRAQNIRPIFVMKNNIELQNNNQSHIFEKQKNKNLNILYIFLGIFTLGILVYLIYYCKYRRSSKIHNEENVKEKVQVKKNQITQESNNNRHQNIIFIKSSSEDYDPQK